MCSRTLHAATPQPPDDKRSHQHHQYERKDVPEERRTVVICCTARPFRSPHAGGVGKVQASLRKHQGIVLGDWRRCGRWRQNRRRHRQGCRRSVRRTWGVRLRVSRCTRVAQGGQRRRVGRTSPRLSTYVRSFSFVCVGHHYNLARFHRPTPFTPDLRSCSIYHTLYQLCPLRLRGGACHVGQALAGPTLGCVRPKLKGCPEHPSIASAGPAFRA